MVHTLIIFARRPIAGRAKTRLCPPLSYAVAAELYACFLRDTLDLARRTPVERRIIAYEPEDAAAYFSSLAPDMMLLPQRGADLGARLDYCLTSALAEGSDAAVAIGSDSPTLPVAYVAQAFTLLAAHDVVLGPSEDGGYYLIGVRRPPGRLVREVVMSTPTVLRDTLAIAEELGLQTALLPGWYDVDTAADLDRLRAELAVAPPDVASATRGFLAALGE